MRDRRAVRTYGEIFAYREFRALFAARCVTMAAVSVQGLALATTTYASTGSTLLTALAMFGGPLITLLGSATVLGASDSLGPRRASVIMPMAYAVTCAVQAVPGLPWGMRFAVLALPYLVGSATSGSTLRLLAEIVPPEGYLLGRATLNIAVGVMQIVGYSIGGLLLTWFSTSDLFLGAAAAALAVVIMTRFGIEERVPTQQAAGLLRRTHAVNRALLGSPVIRPLYVTAWVPNGLIVGCEALFVPYGGRGLSGYLFGSAAAGMLLGDVLMGRVIPPAKRDRLIEPMRLLLAAPYVVFLTSPPLPVAVALTVLASIGYSASLPLQERLVGSTDPAVRGQVFGLYSTGLMAGQSFGAALAGLVATWMAPSIAMGVVSLASLAVTVALVPGLRRSAPARSQHDLSWVR